MRIEDEIREVLHSVARRVGHAPDAWDRLRMVQEGAQPIPAARRLAVILAAASIGLVGVGIAALAFRGTRSVPPAVGPSSDVGSSRTLDLHWAASASSFGIAARDGWAWVSGSGGASLVGSDESIRPLPFAQGPFGLDATPSATWAVGYDPEGGAYVARFESPTSEPDLSIPMGGFAPQSVVADEDSVWVFGDAPENEDDALGTLLRLDASTGTELARAQLGRLVTGMSQPVLLASSVDQSDIWIMVSDVQGGRVQSTSLIALDAQSLSRRATFALEGGSYVLAAHGGVWIQGDQGPVVVDPSSGDTTSIDVPDQHAVAFAQVPDGVWLVGGNSEEVRLFLVGVGGTGAPTGVQREIDVARQAAWGSADATYDDSGRVWLLYEDGHVQEVSVGVP
jgi:hypothetical protein